MERLMPHRPKVGSLGVPWPHLLYNQNYGSQDLREAGQVHFGTGSSMVGMTLLGAYSNQSFIFFLRFL